MGPKSYVYLIRVEETDMYKVGVSSDPQKRCERLQRGLYPSLTLAYIIPTDVPEMIERRLRLSYRRFRISGDLFYLDAERLARIEAEGWPLLSIPGPFAPSALLIGQE